MLLLAGIIAIYLSLSESPAPPNPHYLPGILSARTLQAQPHNLNLNLNLGSRPSPVWTPVNIDWADVPRQSESPAPPNPHYLPGILSAGTLAGSSLFSNFSISFDTHTEYKWECDYVTRHFILNLGSSSW